MTGFAVIGAIGINTPQLATQGIELYWQHLSVMVILQRHFRRHDIVSHRVHRQMRLAPDSPLFCHVFHDVPLSFTKYLQAGRVDNQVGDVPLIGPQGESENPLEHQEGADGMVGVELAEPPFP